jgi:3-oxoacyl-(acyl-carrier-protein) synthase
MQQTPISITGLASISPLGDNRDTILEAYLDNNHYFTKKKNTWVAQLNKESLEKIESLKSENTKYKPLDNSVLFSILSSRNAIKEANWPVNSNFGVNIGSSRGATALFENHHEAFLKNNKAETLTSPTTTLGNISSWVAHDLQTSGPEISHSITCSTALHALLNGVVWLKSGLAHQFLIGGTEAPLTPFTIAQMQALKIYTQDTDTKYPCKALDLNKTKNSMILSEASASLCLESGILKNRLAQIVGIGYATEILQHHVSLSSTGDCFKKSMQMALDQANLETVDVIVAHTPGTIKGDKAEYNAIKNTFKTLPFLTNNKWKIGHSLGASGVLSLEMAILMLQEQTVFNLPFFNQNQPKSINSIMVNAVGFGGNAVSVIIKK